MMMAADPVHDERTRFHKKSYCPKKFNRPKLNLYLRSTVAELILESSVSTTVMCAGDTPTDDSTLLGEIEDIVDTHRPTVSVVEDFTIDHEFIAVTRKLATVGAGDTPTDDSTPIGGVEDIVDTHGPAVESSHDRGGDVWSHETRGSIDIVCIVCLFT